MLVIILVKLLKQYLKLYNTINTYLKIHLETLCMHDVQ